MGRLRKFLPLTAGGFIVAWLAIAGMPPFSGFWSKDEILAETFASGDYALWVVGVLGAGLTALYMTREVWLVFFGNERFRESEATEGLEHDPEGDLTHTPTVAFGDEPRLPNLHGDPHESPRSMTTPILVLAFLAAIGGLLSLPFSGLEFLTEWLDPVFSDVPEIHVSSFLEGFLLSCLSVAVGLTGIFIAHRFYRNGLRRPSEDPWLQRLGPVGRLFGHAYYYDELIGRVVAGPLTKGADLLDRFDGKVIDGAVNGVGRLFREAGGTVRKVADRARAQLRPRRRHRRHRPARVHARAGRDVDGLPDPHLHHLHARRRRRPHAARAGAPARDRQGRRLPRDRGHRWASPPTCSGASRRARRACSSSSTTAGSPTPASRTSSASTASACSWSP